jgi:hypothetical protein
VANLEDNMEDIEDIQIIKSDGTSDYYIPNYPIKKENLCPECDQKYDNYSIYCKPCNSIHFSNNFAHWTSGDSNIDELIRNSQLNAKGSPQLIEWIEYSNFENIEFIAYGGFGSVYKVIWKDSPITKSYWNINKHTYWNIEKSGWNRINNKEVAIKKF